MEFANPFAAWTPDPDTRVWCCALEICPLFEMIGPEIGVRSDRIPGSPLLCTECGSILYEVVPW